MTYSPDGTRLALVSDEGLIAIWDADTAAELTVLRHGGPVRSVAFSHDGKRLASVGDRTILIWDTTTWKQVLTTRGHMGEVICAAFSSDGQRLATGGGDKFIKLWDMASGKETLILRGHTSPVSGIVFTPDGRRLISYAGGIVKIWDASPLPAAQATTAPTTRPRKRRHRKLSAVFLTMFVATRRASRFVWLRLRCPLEFLRGFMMYY